MGTVVGTWLLSIDWRCDGDVVVDGIRTTFNEDGTWIAAGSLPHTGRWFQVECLVVWNFDGIPNITYTGYLSANGMAGVQGYTLPEGSKGCFSARRDETPAIDANAPYEGFDLLLGP